MVPFLPEAEVRPEREVVQAVEQGEVMAFLHLAAQAGPAVRVHLDRDRDLRAVILARQAAALRQAEPAASPGETLCRSPLPSQSIPHHQHCARAIL